MQEPKIITGNFHQDERGKLVFVNDFDMFPVKRFYTISHPDTTIIRAWQGHRKEQKWFFVLEGGFEVVLVKPDNWSTPSTELPTEKYNLTADKNQVLHVPGGFVTGFKAITANSKMIVYSDMNVVDSKLDDYRFDKQLWYKWE